MASTFLHTQHEDMIHDAQPDYYGKRLATCSSDRTIKIFEIGETTHTQIAELKGHEGPVWQVCWAHPKFGPILASCSYDRKVFIWREMSANQWSKVYEFDKHDSSVNSICWAPHELGLWLATASSDGTIRILKHKGDNAWDVQTISEAHPSGVNAVSWAPAIPAGSVLNANPPSNNLVKKIVSGGCDNLVKIWNCGDTDVWKEEGKLEHNDWVRDVSWAPNIGIPVDTIASCSQDGIVIIWNQAAGSSNWTAKTLPKFSDVIWRVSWSITGNILAVSGGDNKVTLWKENMNGEWQLLSSVEERESEN